MHALISDFMQEFVDICSSLVNVILSFLISYKMLCDNESLSMYKEMGVTPAPHPIKPALVA